MIRLCLVGMPLSGTLKAALNCFDKVVRRLVTCGKSLNT